MEGPDGAGTTTQAAMLAEALRARDLRVRLTAEPSDGPVGRVVRTHVRGEVSLPPEAAALAFTADRADHLARVIRPALADGQCVVCDRYLLSTLAYQGSEGVDRRWLMDVSASFDVPDLTLLLMVPPGERARRIASRGPAERYEAASIQDALDASYSEAAQLLRSAGQRVEEVDASGTPEQVHRRLLAIVDGP